MPQVTDPGLLAELEGGNPSPAIYRTPTKPLPQQRPADAIGSELSNQQKQASLAEAPLNLQKKQLDIEEKRRKLEAGDAASASEGERKNAAFVRRALGANEIYNSLNIGPRSFVGDKIQETTPGLLNQLPSAIGNSSERQQADAAEKEFVSAVLRSDSGAAIPDNEIATAIELYFPQPGDGEAVIEQKKQARQRAIDGLMSSAGRLADDVTQPEGVKKPVTELLSGDDETITSATLAERYDDYVPGSEFFDKEGNVAGYQSTDGAGVILIDPSEVNNEIEARKQRLEQKATEADELLGEGGLTARAKQGLTLGFGDEIAGLTGGVVSAVQGDGFQQGYRDARDIQRIRNERTDERTGLAGDVAEIGGSLFLPGGVAKSVGSAAKVGAGYGALGGFGYGEGLQGSTANALLGFAGGGALGAGAQKAGNALLNRAGNKAELGQRAKALSDAGTAENVTVNRAMVNPALENRVTGAQSTVTGGPIVDKVLAKTNSEIGDAVERLGQGGTPLDEITGGQLVETAANRSIDKTGKASKVKYDRAEKLAGNAKVEPKQSLQIVKQEIADLSETAPTNKAEIAFLEDLQSIFSKNLSVKALRRERTKLRKKISNGDLVFGEGEARVLSIMDTAAEDIRTGLIAQGKPAAAKAFDAADKAYRARMEYIGGTIQKVIGKRQANLSSEQMFRKFNAMAKPGGDAAGLRKFYAGLTPDEALDVSATFADKLGKNKDGNFTTAQFVSQVEKLPEAARKTIFGTQGEKSIQKLLLLAKEHKRVYGKLNHSRSGVANAARDYRQWLGAAVGIGGPLAGGGASSALGGATIAAGALAKDAISAKLLMSPNITKWIKQAPKTSNPKAINAHFSQLGKIAKAEPSLAADIDILQDAILKAANDNPGRVAAQDSNTEDGGPPPN